MKYQSIRKHFAPYSIYRRRKTTINAAFASAIAPSDTFDENRVRGALILLGQNPDQPLRCVYCDEPAATWDHVQSRVKNGVFSGAGHRLGNLLPSCRTCNERKGQKTWQEYLNTMRVSEEERNKRTAAIAAYLKTYEFAEPPQIRTEHHDAYDGLREKIHELMKQADELAKTIRADYQTTNNTSDVIR
jgi:hypothetical protein